MFDSVWICLGLDNCSVQWPYSVYCIRHIQKTVYFGICRHIENHIPHYYSIFTHSDALLRYVQAYWCIFTALCIPRIFTMYSWCWHIYNRRHIQNPLKLWPDIFRTVYSDIIRHTQRCVTLVYAETWHIRNPEIFRTLS